MKRANFTNSQNNELLCSVEYLRLFKWIKVFKKKTRSCMKYLKMGKFSEKIKKEKVEY